MAFACAALGGCVIAQNCNAKLAGQAIEWFEDATDFRCLMAVDVAHIRRDRINGDQRHVADRLDSPRQTVEVVPQAEGSLLSVS